MELDGLKSTVFASSCCDLDLWPFDLISISKAQVHTWPSFGEIYTKILYLPGFSGHCLLWPWPLTFWPQNVNSISTNPSTPVTIIGRNSLHFFRYGVHDVFERTDSLTHSLTDGQTRIQYASGTVFNGDRGIKSTLLCSCIDVRKAFNECITQCDIVIIM